MRKLPVYLVLDTSASMAGEPLVAVEIGMQLLLNALRQDPYALETAFLSVITFDAQARQIAPLGELATFRLPELKLGATTALGAALKLLAERVDHEVAKTTRHAKGDWKPMVFLMTDGLPTDDWQAGLREFKRREFGTIVACAAGPRADAGILKQITENVVALDTADTQSLQAFFKWVSASVSTGSQKIESGGGKEVFGLDELPPPPPEMNVVV